MEYVDGFVVAVANENKDLYIEHSTKVAKAFRKHGALSYVESWAEEVPDGELTSFPLAVKLKEGESVVFSWITWPDKETRQAGFESAMQEPEMQQESSNMPFDGKRIIFGGFEKVVDL